MYKEYRISGTSDHVYIDGEVQQSVKLNADGFFKTLLSLPSHRSLDLLRIATGVYAVDRICKRAKRISNENGIRQLHLTFDVRDIEFWMKSDIKQLLLETLAFLTDDDWVFDFKKTEQVPSDLGHQDFLPLSKPFAMDHGALYSGGLDSAAGLATRLLDGTNNFMLVTVGHQSGLHHRVEKQLSALSTLIEASRRAPVNILHSTLRTSLESGKSKRISFQERTQRSRAFLFCAAAAIAAKAYDVSTIELFENGVGAINFPLMSGMLGSGLSTRGAHPTFLRLMTKLSTLVVEKSVSFALPFEAQTKAEVLQNLVSTTGLAEWAQESRSCIHTSLREEGKTHCGRCPGCIERRQAFLSAGIEENLDGYQTNILTEPLNNQDELDYFHLYKLEAKRWEQGAESTLRRMTNHLRLTDVPDEKDKGICELQSRYSRETLKIFGMPLGSHNNPLISSPLEKLTYENGVA